MTSPSPAQAQKGLLRIRACGREFQDFGPRRGPLPPCPMASRGPSLPPFLSISVCGSGVLVPPTLNFSIPLLTCLKCLPLRLKLQSLLQSQESLGCTDPSTNKLLWFLHSPAQRFVLYMCNIPDPNIAELLSKERFGYSAIPSPMPEEQIAE